MQATGIHSHDDGVIHWHAWSGRASGRNAQIGIFLDNYDVELSDDKLELPEGDGDNPLSRLIFEPPDRARRRTQRTSRSPTRRARHSAMVRTPTLKAVVWTDFNDPDSSQVYTSNFTDIPFDQDGLVVTIAFVPDDVEVVMPVVGGEPARARRRRLGDRPDPRGLRRSVIGRHGDHH